MNSFWDTSWEKVAPERLREYVSDFDLKPDSIIEQLHSRSIKTVCDAGCGCGIYSLKLAANGFSVSGFDISAHAVSITRKLLDSASAKANLKTASILSTGYADNEFDCVVSRDVIDHMCKKDGTKALQELYRITKPGGIIFVTLDHLDSEYETEAHTLNGDGDFLFTDGKWRGMVFHPYSEQEIMEIVPSEAICQLESQSGEFILKLQKSVI